MLRDRYKNLLFRRDFSFWGLGGFLKEGSERALAKQVGLSRSSLRQLRLGDGNPTLKTLERVSYFLNKRLAVFFLPAEESDLGDSTVALSLAVQREGLESWKIHFMNLVDEFRSSKDIRLLLLPPVSSLPFHLKALLASIVFQLCLEEKMDIPSWAKKTYYLPHPWFVSGIENLKATALLESPLAFRRNNIFVLENFLRRI